ncbi:replication protein A 70 kDa DNA-binding subunit B-like isoform X2 [Primulina eburnea]|uniref:replication protein A 70 kDa DNA-binding subunit B-like isoform X2 n=1 Tax=Primulina eburnea TaxID=1245227 RepID=UPI003C6CB724
MDMHYCFKATICDIENKSKPWYDACASCLKATIQTTKGINCANCTKQPVQIMQRYRLTMTVQDNDTSGRLTLFEDVASDFIGCSVDEYIELLNKEQNETKFPIALENSIKEEHVFLFKMDPEIVKQKKELSIVVEGFQRPFLDIFDTNQPGKQVSATSFHDRKREKKNRFTENYKKVR